MIDSLTSLLEANAAWFGAILFLVLVVLLGRGLFRGTSTRKQVRNPTQVAPATTRENTAAETLWVLQDNERQKDRSTLWVGVPVVVALLVTLSFVLFPSVEHALTFYAAWWRQVVASLIAVVAFAFAFNRRVHTSGSVAVEALQWVLLLIGIIAAGYAVVTTSHILF